MKGRRNLRAGKEEVEAGTGSTSSSPPLIDILLSTPLHSSPLPGLLPAP